MKKSEKKTFVRQMDGKLNENKLALSIGLVFGIGHIIFVLLNFAGVLPGLWVWSHMISLPYTLQAFNIAAFIIGPIIAFIVGYISGWVFAYIYNNIK